MFSCLHLLQTGHFEQSLNGYEHFKQKLHLISDNCVRFNEGDEDNDEVKALRAKAAEFRKAADELCDKKLGEAMQKVFGCEAV